MKITDLLRLAIRNLKGQWVVLPAAGIAISVFCLCFAGTILTTVSGEKAQPCELDISAEGSAKITDTAIVQLLEIENVLDVTPLLQVPVTIETGGYAAELTLTGIKTSYLKEKYVRGGSFSESTVMPYIVLNEAACKEFLEDDTEPSDEAPDIDWLGASFSVKTGENMRPIAARVCGILEGEGKQSVAFISLDTAKELLGEKGLNPFKSAKVRVVDIGQALSVSEDLQSWGFRVENANAEQQSRWDMWMKEMGYLIVTGVFSLLCASVLISAWRRISLLEQRDAMDMLRWMGIRRIDITGLLVIQSGVIAVVGVIIGIIVALCLPSFLPQEIKSTSVFMRPIPWWIADASVVFCILFGARPILFKKIYRL